MFELSVALKYLLPRKRQLSVSIIALLSVFVIALVVWLVVVFLSVTHGIEKRWVSTLVALNAPMRLTPTEAYYDSYYYQVDGHSAESDYSFKSIGEKLSAANSDPYDPIYDAELPSSLPEPDLDPSGNLRDPVKGAFTAIEGLKGVSGLHVKDYEAALGSLRLRQVRPVRHDAFQPTTYSQNFITQVSYLGSFDGENTSMSETLLVPSTADLAHYLDLLSVSGRGSQSETPRHDSRLTQTEVEEKLNSFFDGVNITHLQTQKGGWVIPQTLYPEQGEVLGIYQPQARRVVVPVGRKDLQGEVVTVRFDDEGATLIQGNEELPYLPLVLPAETLLPVEVDRSSFAKAHDADEVKYTVKLPIQGVTFQGTTAYYGLTLGKAEALQTTNEAGWIHQDGNGQRILPVDSELGQGILLAKSFRDTGTLVGDRGYLAYYASTPSSIQEQRIPVYVAGFYDPGIMPTGSRFILTNPEVTRDLRQAVSQVTQDKGNGINVWFKEFNKVDQAKATVLAELEANGLTPYWTVETYKEYEFSRPLVQQFQSDRNLFTLIALIVIVVACSNIISMLIVLVNDKKKEIGILQSMGASSKSIAFIFATCGTVMGLLGSLIGIGAALFTLSHLQGLINLLSLIQGHDAFQTAYFGSSLPNELSGGVLIFVVIATIFISVIAGLIPAVKATMVRPAAILRSE